MTDVEKKESYGPRTYGVDNPVADEEGATCDEYRQDAGISEPMLYH